MKDFRNLSVWKKAHQLALSTYRNTLNFPRDELYGITSQIRRASVSVPSNIARAVEEKETLNSVAFFKLRSVQQVSWNINYVVSRPQISE
jgi:four helix bundle protein